MYGGVLSGVLTMGLFSALRVYPPCQCLPLQSRTGTPDGQRQSTLTLKWGRCRIQLRQGTLNG